MSPRALIRWFIFVLYVALFFVIPLTLLFDWTGCLVGAGLGAVVLILLGFQGTDRIAKRLRVVPLARAEAASVYAMVEEFCRRLDLPVPRIGVIETPGLNTAVFGFFRRHSYVAITRGVLNLLKRDELLALLGREIYYLKYGNVFCDTWLSQFLSILDDMLNQTKPKPTLQARRQYPFKLFLRQVFLYPLTLFPAFILRGKRDPQTIDLQSLQVSKKPKALAEALRIVEAMHERIPFQASFSSRHLFLLAPPTQDPLARVFFAKEPLSDRIGAMESLTQVVTLT